MSPRPPFLSDDPDRAPEVDETPADAELWFLPGPDDDLPQDWPVPRHAPAEAPLVRDWAAAQAGQAARLARVAARLGALDDRLLRGPEGWRHRLALIEAAELSWFAGDRLAPDRVALWVAMRLSGVQDSQAALARVGWAVRRLTGGPGPEGGLAEFLCRHESDSPDPEATRLSDHAADWQALTGAAPDLHPIVRACMGFHLWDMAGLGRHGARIESAVTASRVAAGDGDGRGAVFAPLAMAGAAGLRAGGPPPTALARWLDGMEAAILTAMRQLDDLQHWTRRAETAMAGLSGRTPPALRAVLAEWPLVSAPMAEALTGASRAAVQRNLAWMQDHGLVQEITGHGRFRMWRIAR